MGVSIIMFVLLQVLTLFEQKKRILVNSRMNGKYQTVSPGTLNLGPLLPIVEADFNLENNC